MNSKSVPDYRSRVIRVHAGLEADGLDGVLITDLANIFYLTGFRGSDGVALISADEVVLMVDGRYGTQAKEVAQFGRLIVYPSKSEGIIGEVGRLGWSKVGVEARSMTLELYESLRKGLANISWNPLGDWMSALRSRKEPSEIETLKRANRIADDALLELIPGIQAGMEEREVGFELECIMRKRGADGCSFPMIVAGGANAAQPHAKTGHRKLTSGELFLIDYGCSLDGYQTDQTVTFSIGTPSSEMIRIYDAVRESHDRAIEAIRVGLPASQLDKVAREVLEKAGLSEFFTHGLGHGIGMQVHEFPQNFKNSTAILEEGMAFTVEPGVYVPGIGGVRIEDAVLLTRSGVELLTSVDKGLRRL